MADFMKKIALIMPSELPVPSVRGGAIEELVTILIEQNEIEQKAEFVVFSVANEEAEERAKKYKHTKIIYIPPAALFDRIINRVLRYANKIYKKKTLLDVAHYRKAHCYLKKEKVDAIVAEGGMYHEFRRFTEDYGKENMYLHIHHHLRCTPEIDGIFGNVIGISEFAVKEWMCTTNAKDTKAYVVYNCVNEDKFAPRISRKERAEIRKRFGFTDDDIVVLYCGRILEVKGVREVLLAIKELENPHIKLLIIGNADFAINTQTSYMKEVQLLVEKIGDRVQFTGYIPNSQLYQYYQSADMQVIPSLWEEAAGLVAIEGMLSELPLIVTKSGGLIEYATTDVAIQIEREQIIEELKREVSDLALNEKKRKQMATLGLERAKVFSKERFYESFIEVIEHEGNGEK